MNSCASDWVSRNLWLIMTMVFLTVEAMAQEPVFRYVALPDTVSVKTVEVDQISITAMKQGSLLRTEPLASSVIGSGQIGLDGVSAVKDIQMSAPNFYMPDYGSRTTSSIYVRGIGSRIDQPSVGMIVDNLSIADKNMYDMDIPDVERIEIIRGPQSTLFGKNTMGGVINVTTLSPFAYQGIKVGFDYGDRNSCRLYTSILQKINSVGLAFTARYYHTDGFWRNSYTGRLTDKEDNAFFRLKAMYHKGFLKIENNFSFGILRQGGYPYAYVGNDESETHPDLIGQICYNEPCTYDRNGLLESLTVGYEWEKVSLTSVTGYQYLDDCMHLDNDFLPDCYFVMEQAKKRHDVSEDLVLKSRTNTRYKYLFGLYGSFSTCDMRAPVTFQEDGIEHLILDNVRPIYSEYGDLRWGNLQGKGSDRLCLNDDFTTNNVDVAMYHQSQLDLGGFSLTGALRVQMENIQMRYHCYADLNYSYFPYDSKKKPVEVRNKVDLNDVLEKQYWVFLPKFTAAYYFNDRRTSSVYASVSKGYKPGGFNTQMFSEVLQQKVRKEMGAGSDPDVRELTEYDPEQSWNYEIGGHYTSPSSSFSMDADLFYIDCHDQQLTVFPEGQTTGRMMTNAGKTRSLGVEVSMTYSPVERLTLSTSYGFTDARFTEFTSGGVDYAGKHIPYAPENTFSLRGQYALPVGKEGHSIVLSAVYSGAGRVYWDEANTLSQPFYSLFDWNVRYDADWWSVDLWMKNTFDSVYDIFYFESMNNRFLQHGRPRTFGVRFNCRL